MSTIACIQRQEWFMKKGAVMCQCGRDCIFYRCYQKECQLVQNFCFECKDDELHKHFQNIVRCYEVISKSDQRWSLIKEKFDNLRIKVIASYQKVEPLVKYFEAVSINMPFNEGDTQPHRCITADYLHLLSMDEKLNKIMTQVECISKDGLIDQIDDINIQYEQFQNVIVNSEYLADITEDVIYNTYKTAIQANHSRGFKDFSQDH